MLQVDGAPATFAVAPTAPTVGAPCRWPIAVHGGDGAFELDVAHHHGVARQFVHHGRRED